MYVRAFVQLGFLQKCLDWIYDHILSPVFDFMKNLLNTLFKTLFENVFLPLLELQYKLAIEMIVALLENFIYDLLYGIMRTLLWVLDAVEKTFRLFGGLLPVYTRQADGSVRESGSFLLTIFRNNYIITALLGMIAASFVLCFLVSLIATAKSIFDMEEDNNKRRTASKVLRLTANALLRLILIPIMALFMILLGDAILKSIDMATNPSQTSISNIVFTMGTLDAVRTKDFSDAAYYNSTTRAAALSGASQEIIDSTNDFGLKDKYRKTFYEGDKLSNGTLKRDDITVVLQTFDIRKIDYMITIGGAILFIYIFGVMAISMISRAFDLVLLLLVEPFFAAYMPLDDGAHFQEWQETFIGRLVSCYGMVVGVNVYLGVIELIFSNKVSFFGPGTTPGVVYVVNLIFAAAGAYCIIQAGPMITGIMSEKAGSRELEGISAGTTITTAVMGAAAYPFKKAADKFFGWASEKAGDEIANMLDTTGRRPNSAPGKGDAYGQPRSDSPGIGSQFNGKKGGAAIPSNIPTAKSSEKPDKTPAAKQEKTPAAKPGQAALAGIIPADGQEIDKTKSKAQGANAKPGQAADQQKFSGKPEAGSTDKPSEKPKDQQKDQPGGKGTTDRKSGNKTVEEALGAQLLEGIMDAQSEGQQGFDQSQLKTGQMDYSFLAAGNQQDPQGHGYVWVGQEAVKEEKKQKEMDELLKAEIDEAALLAAESSTGLDLNGDGAVTGTKSEKELAMHDILGTGSTADVDLFAESPLDGSLSGHQDNATETFMNKTGNDKPLTMEEIVSGPSESNIDLFAESPLDGSLSGHQDKATETFMNKTGNDKPLTMEEIVSGPSESNIDLFADSPIDTGSTGSFGSGTEFTSTNLTGPNKINDENALFGTVDSSSSQSATDSYEPGLGGSYSLSDDENGFTEPSLDGFFDEDNTLSTHEIFGSSSDMTMYDISGSSSDMSVDSIVGEPQDPITKKDTLNNLLNDDDV